MGADTLPWIRKHCPKGTSDVIAQESAISNLKSYVSDYKNQKKKAILIYGPSGCGKTSSVYAIANDLNLEIVEINASDFRNKAQINAVAGSASKQMSLFGLGKLILIDELDGIAGRQDYGGIPALVKVIQESAWPIVITANNPFNNKFSSIRNKSEMLQFNELSGDNVLEILKDICDKEKVDYDSRVLKVLAMKAGGDSRGAVNDIQIISTGNSRIDEKSISELSFRDKTDTILSALTRIFKSTDIDIAKGAFDTVQEDMDQRFLGLMKICLRNIKCLWI